MVLVIIIAIEYFMCFVSVNPHNSPMKQLYL